MKVRHSSAKFALLSLGSLLFAACLSLAASTGASARPNCDQEPLPPACGGNPHPRPRPQPQQLIDLVPTRIQAYERTGEFDPSAHQELAINVKNVGSSTLSPSNNYSINVTVNGTPYQGLLYGSEAVHGQLGGAIAPGETGTILLNAVLPVGTFQSGQAVIVHIDTSHALQSGSGVFNNDEATLPIQ
jgi:hypothetical protein